MAVIGTFTPIMQLLTLTADANANSVTVSRNAAGNILGNGGAIAISGGVPTVANTSLIQILGQNGNDILTLDEAMGALPSAYLFGGFGNDLMTGGSAADTLFGEGDNDTLLGKGGGDLLLGGAGNDTLAGGDFADLLYGEDGDDLLIWNPGDDSDLFEGGAGIDTAEVNGGGGAETFLVTANGDRVRLDRINPAPFTIDIGTSENLIVHGNAGNDQMTASGDLAGLIRITFDGGAGTDFLFGGNGADTLSGGIGSDSLDGGAGNDTYVLDDEASGLDTVTDTSGTDTITSTIDRSLAFADYAEIENLVLVGGTVGSGNALGNAITGNAAANVLDGGAGADTLRGQGGNDSYFVDNGADVLVEFSSGGIDAARSSVSYTLASNVENLTLGGTAPINGFGNAGANTLIGNSATNVLTGRGGNDKMLGGAGNDVLVGGRGRDLLNGGTGNDRFDFNLVAETGKTSGTRDIIEDFRHGFDNLDLSTIDANGAAAGGGRFHLIRGEGAAFDGDRGALRWDQQNFAGTTRDKTLIYGDVNGDGRADFAIQLTGLKTLTAGDFAL